MGFNSGFKGLMLSGNYVYYQVPRSYILRPVYRFIYVFCMDLRTNSDYYPIQR